LISLFELPSVALRLWHLPRLPAGPYSLTPDAELLQYAQSLTTPYCGPYQGQAPAAWLSQQPASLAITALGKGGGAAPFGLLVIGASDPERFSADMGTVFLETLARLASAALSRLATQ
jgi:uncharacterized protein YigA (DUF484 family)